MGRATHVFLHLAHAFGAFDVQAAAVKTHTLADDAQARVLGFAPGQLDQARRAGARAAHGVDGREIGLEQRVTYRLPELRAMLFGERPGGIGQLFRPHVFGRRVDQVACGGNGFGQRQATLGFRAGFQHELGRRPAARLVAVELVAAQRPRQGGLFGRHLHALFRQGVAAFRQGQRESGQRKGMGRMCHACKYLQQLAVDTRHQNMAVGDPGKSHRLQPAPTGDGQRGSERL